jgi:hypothetical protein
MIVFRYTLPFSIGILLVLSQAFPVMSQSVVEIRFGRNTVHVGEVVSAYLRIELPANDEGAWISKDSLLVGVNSLFSADSLNYEPFADIEILNYGVFTNLEKEGRILLPSVEKPETGVTRVIEDSLRILFYNPGEFICFGPALRGMLPSTLSRKPEVIKVIIPDAIADKDSLSLQPIKDIIYEPAIFLDYWPWMLGLLLLTLLIAGFFYYLKRRKKGKSISVLPVYPDISPHEKALGALENLSNSRYWLIEGDKAFQSAFTLILREYTAQRYKMPALEMTTAEIVQSLKINGLSNAHLSTLEEMLQLADLVKFANASTPEPMYQDFLAKAVEFVHATKQIQGK